MNKTNCTSGPYIVLDLRSMGQECLTIVSLNTGEALCRIRNEVSGRPISKEDEANANLFKTALDLLEVCEQIRQWDMLDVAGDGPWFKKILDEVIDKARGRR